MKIYFLLFLFFGLPFGIGASLHFLPLWVSAPMTFGIVVAWLLNAIAIKLHVEELTKKEADTMP